MRLGIILAIKLSLFVTVAVVLISTVAKATEPFVVPEGYELKVQTIGDVTVESIVPIHTEAEAFAEIAPAAGPQDANTGNNAASDEAGPGQAAPQTNNWVLFEYE